MDIKRSRDDIQPYIVLNREKIETSGATNLNDFLKNWVTMSVSAYSPSMSSDVRGNTSQINLRGLGSDETLVLVDGRRAAGIRLGDEASQPNLNGIPLSAVERIEVLPTTASGIYGGSATGGVVNVILRRDYAGADLRLAYGNTFESDVATRRVDISSGMSIEGGRTNLLFTGSYSDANALLARERSLVQRGREHIRAHNPNFFYNNPIPPRGLTPNIRSVNAQNLVLKDGTQLGKNIAFVPESYAGVAADAGRAFLGTAGDYNLDLANTAQTGGGNRGMLNSPTVRSMMMTTRRDFTPTIRGFLDLNVSKNAGEFTVSPPGSSRYQISSTAANNPFQQDIWVSFPLVGMDSSIESKYESRRVVVGLIGELPRSWQAAIDFTWNRDQFSYSVVSSLDEARLSSDIINGSFDVLRDLNTFPVNFQGYESPNTSISPLDGTLRSTAVRLAGPVPWNFLGGKPSLSALFELRDESNGQYTSTGINGESITPERTQSVGSFYIEARVPFVADHNRIPWINALELQVAGRLDRYKVTGAIVDQGNLGETTKFIKKESSIDPTIGLRYKPIPAFTVRASYGTGYLPPSVSQVVPGISFSYEGEFSGLIDPLRGNEPLGTITVRTGGNPNLQAEKSESFAAGVIWTPPLGGNLRLSVDWTQIKKVDNITSIANLSQSDFDSEHLVSGLITRASRSDSDPYSVGPVIAINTGLFNIARLRAEAIDLALDYSLDTQSFGVFGILAGATRLISLGTKLTSEAPSVENAGVSNSFSDGEGGLRWSANTSLSWRRGSWLLGWSSHYYDSYFLNTAHAVVANQGAASIPSQIYHNMFGRYRFGSSATGWNVLADSEIQISINNVLNEAPPVDVTANFGALLYSPWGDPRLSNYSLSIRKQFGGR